MNEDVRPRMDLLKMTRLQVAAVLLVGNHHISKERLQAAARTLDEAIDSQFPASDTPERAALATHLARQLDHPNPGVVGGRMKAFYTRKSRPSATAPSGNEDADAAGDAVLTRSICDEDPER